MLLDFLNWIRYLIYILCIIVRKVLLLLQKALKLSENQFSLHEARFFENKYIL